MAKKSESSQRAEEENQGETSIVQIAATTSKSLRATIPQGIVSHLNLKEGTTLSWKIKIVDGELVVIVRPVKNDSKPRK
ncbi:MAG: AbrB/MazE/SpoVT family DNA-binding domain-containing protein [Rhabdochlamydiaceae bacterium]